ncbi:MAG: hypothetical protein K2K92_04105 [Duncaniella sp.]|nr:hypothetical protein [Duncaniella sp.]
MKKNLTSLFTFAGGCLAGFLVCDNIGLSMHGAHAESGGNGLTVNTETIVMHDTLRLRPTLIAERSSVRTVRLPVAQLCDSAQSPPSPSSLKEQEDTYTTVCRARGDTLTLRAETRVYADSNYRAVVSGIDPRLDSLVIFRPETTVTRMVTEGQQVRNDTRRWSLGVTAGVTATSHGLAPGVCIGVSYRLW